MLHFPPWKIWSIVAVLVLGTIFALPNLLTRQQSDALPSWLPHSRLNLGLDLQGGSHLLFEVGVNQLVHERLTSVVDSIRVELRKASIGYTALGVQDQSAVVKLRDPSAVDAARPILRQIANGNRMQLDLGSDGTATFVYNSDELRDLKSHAVDQSIEIVRRRIDQFGTQEPTIQRQGEDRILVQLPGVREPERVKQLIGETAKMTFRLVDVNVSPEAAKAGQLPPTDEVLPSAEDPAKGYPKDYVVQKRVMVSGENLVDAQPSFREGLPVVTFKFDSVGARRFGEATRENVGKPFAIVLDNKVISAPRIREAILGGSGEISGSFTTQSAQDLALLLRAGALPAPLTVIEERTVGADLGADSIAAGKLACIVGIVLIVIAMVLLYGLFGLFANVALVFNAVLLIGGLSIFNATLTLPGIAGIVLTLGMAVDANVLVYERIREELRSGRSPVTAIDHGYGEAMRTIIDSHVTTLISSFLLFMFGTGTIKGFGLTLTVGIAISLFTAVMVTRMITALWFKRTRPKELVI
ncbi:MAG: protein translocase subunit SecD [Dongiaceae bacterium]